MVDQAMRATILGDATIDELRSGLRGALIAPHDDGYDSARAVWNGMIDRRPALIARCHGVADVIAALRFARSQDLLVAVRGGGHNVAGHAVCDDGLVIDLSPMKGIRVDPAARTARAQAGATWGEFDHETMTFGLATTGGLVSTTGIAGFTLGGGIGWLMRKHGLTCDNLISADVVTADGQFVTCSESENSDLFWGLRGGGGNFGIVTSFEYRLHPLGTVLGGLVLYPAAQAREFLQFYRTFTETVPDELTTMFVRVTAPPAPFIPAHLHGMPVVGMAACYAGSLEEGEAALRPLRAFGTPPVDLIGPMPYSALQSMLDATAPPALHNYWKSDYLGALDDEAIATVVEHAAAMRSPLSQTHIHHLGGAVARAGADATAFGHRTAPYLLNALAIWTDPVESVQHRQWAREFSAAMRPFSTGVYVNFLANEGEAGVRASYEPRAYDRLVELKRRYDPTNVFRLNQNIQPTL